MVNESKTQAIEADLKSLLSPINFELKNERDLDSAIHVLLKIKEIGRPFKVDSPATKLILNCLEFIKNSNLKNKPRRIDSLIEVGSRLKSEKVLIILGEYYIQLADVKGTESYFEMIHSLSYLYTQVENYGKALFYLSSFINNPDVNKIKITKSEAVYRELGFLYYQIGSYNQAIKSYSTLANMIKGPTEYYYKPSVYNDIGQCYRELNQKDSALLYYQKASESLKSYKGKIDEKEWQKQYNYFNPVILGSSFPYYIEEKNYTKAYELGYNEYQGGLVGCDKWAQVRGQHKMLVASFYLKSNKAFTKHFGLFSSFNSTFKNNKLRLEAYKYKLRFDLENSTIAEVKKDLNQIELLETELKKRDDNIKSQFVFQSNLEVKDLQIKSIAEKLDIEQSNKKLILIVLCLLSALFFVVFYGYYKSRQKNRLIKEQKEQVDAAYARQNILLKEIHHRVKNNLQLVSSFLQIQVARTKDVKGREVLDESINNINAISLIHENLYNKDDLEYVQLRDYLRSLTHSIRNTFQNNQSLQIVVVCDPILISIDKTISLGLIINELITNSIKHGFVNNIGKIDIHVTQNEIIHFSYKDDGKGMKSTTLVDEKSLGLKLVKMLIDDLEGTYEILNEKGFQLNIKFKL